MSLHRYYPKGALKRLYLDKTRAARLQPPCVLETIDKVFGTRIDIHGESALCWSGNNTEAPAAWVETTAACLVHDAQS